MNGNGYFEPNGAMMELLKGLNKDPIIRQGECMRLYKEFVNKIGRDQIVAVKTNYDRDGFMTSIEIWYNP